MRFKTFNIGPNDRWRVRYVNAYKNGHAANLDRCSSAVAELSSKQQIDRTGDTGRCFIRSWFEEEPRGGLENGSNFWLHRCDREGTNTHLDDCVDPGVCGSGAVDMRSHIEVGLNMVHIARDKALQPIRFSDQPA